MEKYKHHKCLIVLRFDIMPVITFIKTLPKLIRLDHQGSFSIREEL